VARLYAANTTGNILGTMVTGLVLVPRLGFKSGMEIGILLLMIASLVTFARAEGGRALKPAAGSALAVLVTYLTFYPRLDVLSLTAGVFRPVNAVAGQLREWIEQPRELVYQEEDEHVFVTVEKLILTSGDLVLRVNGKTEASSGVDMPNQKLAAHVPLVLHPDPKKVIVLGLGSGATVAAALKHPLDTLECVEISPAVIRASRLFHPTIGDIEADERLSLVQDDARAYLEHSGRRYDVIISEPSNPWIAGIASLFSVEFFQMEKEHLEPASRAGRPDDAVAAGLRDEHGDLPSRRPHLRTRVSARADLQSEWWGSVDGRIRRGDTSGWRAPPRTPRRAGREGRPRVARGHHTDDLPRAPPGHLFEDQGSGRLGADQSR
jgi:spermidine synthase